MLGRWRKMEVEALYRRPKTTKRHAEHKIYPYLLRGLPITRANQVWAMDITYIPMARVIVHLTVVMDWYSRRVISHRVSITMDTQFCLDALEEAVEKYGPPEILIIDQGSQFTSLTFTQYLHDDVFVEQLWRSVKYEHVYLRTYESTSEEKNLGTYFQFYNQRRPHSRLDR